MARRIAPEDRITGIVKAAAAVFSRLGFRQAQMGEIAKEAGVANGTLYNYFESKSHLFLYVIENGIPAEGAAAPSPDKFSGRDEGELLQILETDLKTRGRLHSVETLLGGAADHIDATEEISQIISEVWDVVEKNRVQIAILERSSSELPELQEIYDTNGPQYLRKQIEDYLTDRVKKGAIRPLRSIPGMAIAILESLYWFAWKQDTFDRKPFCPKSEILPDFIATFAQGLDSSKMNLDK